MHLLQATARFTTFITGLGSAAAVVKPVNLAGPKALRNATHTVALTNNSGASDSYLVYLPHDRNTTSSNAADSCLHSRIVTPSFVNVYNTAIASECTSETVNQFIPAHSVCQCLNPFAEQSTFNQAFVSSDVQGFTICLHGGQGLGNCDIFADQLFEFAGCLVGGQIGGLFMFGILSGIEECN